MFFKITTFILLSYIASQPVSPPSTFSSPSLHLPSSPHQLLCFPLKLNNKTKKSKQQQNQTKPKTIGLPGTSTEHGLTRYCKTGHKPSFQPKGRKRIPRSGILKEMLVSVCFSSLILVYIKFFLKC